MYTFTAVQMYVIRKKVVTTYITIIFIWFVYTVPQLFLCRLFFYIVVIDCYHNTSSSLQLELGSDRLTLITNFTRVAATPFKCAIFHLNIILCIFTSVSYRCAWTSVLLCRRDMVFLNSNFSVAFCIQKTYRTNKYRTLIIVYNNIHIRHR